MCLLEGFGETLPLLLNSEKFQDHLSLFPSLCFRYTTHAEQSLLEEHPRCDVRSTKATV